MTGAKAKVKVGVNVSENAVRENGKWMTKHQEKQKTGTSKVACQYILKVTSCSK